MMRTQLDLYTETFDKATFNHGYLSLRFGDFSHRAVVTFDGTPDDIRRVLQAALDALTPAEVPA